jgi:hypothetical protein
MTTGPLQPPAPPAHRGPEPATVLAGALLVLVGLGWLLDAGGIDVPWRAILPAALIAVGLATLAGAFRGRQHGLMAVGLALVVLLTAAAATDWDLDFPLAGGAGERTERPATLAGTAEYELTVGQLTVDLEDLQVPQGTTTVEARVGIGELRVVAPRGVAVEVDARSGLGQVQALDREEGGLGSRLQVRSDDAGDGRRLVLDLRVGIGQVEVDR